MLEQNGGEIDRDKADEWNTFIRNRSHRDEKRIEIHATVGREDDGTLTSAVLLNHNRGLAPCSRGSHEGIRSVIKQFASDCDLGFRIFGSIYFTRDLISARTRSGSTSFVVTLSRFIEVPTITPSAYCKTSARLSIVTPLPAKMLDCGTADFTAFN